MGIFTLSNAPIRKTYKTWYEKSISEFCESSEGITLLDLCNAASGLNYSSLESHVVRGMDGIGAAGASNTSLNLLGFPITATLGTLTAVTHGSNGLSRYPFIKYVSSASAGNLGGHYAGNDISTGSGTDYGYTICQRFACMDAATVAGARQFCGIHSSSAPTNVEPSTLANCIGVGHGSADTNLKIFYGGSVAQTPIDLGANFPANTLSEHFYELILLSFKSLSTKIGYQVKLLNTNYISRGILTANTPGVELPGSSVLSGAFKMWRTNNATALAVALGISAIYRGRSYL